MKFACSCFVISLTGIIIENTMVRSELTCDGHDLRAMMVQLLTLRKEFEDYKLKSENLIQSLSERQTKYENDNRLLNKTIQETGTSFIANENVIQGLNNTVQWMNETIQETMHNQTRFDKVIQGLSNTLQGLNDNLHAQNASIQETLTNLTKSDKVIQDFNTAVQETLKNHTSELAALKYSYSDKLVGFIATSQNDSACNGIVEFKTTLTNNGSGYNSSNGYFTAPYSGIYLFSVQLCFDYRIYGSEAKFQIYSPNRNQYFSASQYAESHETSCTSVTTTAYLHMNDQLYVNCTNNYYQKIDAYQNDYWNMFSGVLINTDNG